MMQMSVDTFIAEHWEKHWLHIRRGERAFLTLSGSDRPPVTTPVQATQNGTKGCFSWTTSTTSSAVTHDISGPRQAVPDWVSAGS